ncbi:sugar phosphate isomerase/epimerase [Chitinophaga horti]|uniref:Sugar phosphate isomerase/epimerase n=1 Tax=Chitinophaga horti TaxID=2920382 RepID=A0ABY6IVE7_9BACT|nr:sugar phosphate isomerase/epimerase family protein [Chitinophaga horti]UYQ91355.1 sugar phosphate isomerase/epimerase [Chitinophaga horti]
MNENNNTRRSFLRHLGVFTAGISLGPAFLTACNNAGKTPGSDSAASGADSSQHAGLPKDLFFQISLAEWSFHQALFAKKMDHLDFAIRAKKEFDIHAVEYVNQFFKDKAKDKNYLGEMKKRCDDNGVKSVLIMCDGEGELGDKDVKARMKAVENHYKWVEAAQFLGCHSIRVNAAGQGTAEEVAKNAADGLGKLTDFAKDFNIGVIVENHGGYSSNGKWLSDVMKTVNRPGCGTLPDFGNFCINRTKPEAQTPEAWAKTTCLEEYDKYQGVQELMPFAKGVSAKTYDFDDAGNSVQVDYARMLKIVKEAGYTGHIGIEYEGSKLSEDEGIKKTRDLLRKVGAQLA